MLGERADPWHPVQLDDAPDVVGIVARIVAEQDEPVATATWLSHHLLADRCRELGFGSLLGGLGGDELNAGEYEYFPALFADLRAAGREAELGAEIDAWAAHHDHPIHRKDRAVAEAMMARLTDPWRPGRILPDRARIERYADALGPAMPDLAGFRARRWSTRSPRRYRTAPGRTSPARPSPAACAPRAARWRPSGWSASTPSSTTAWSS